MRTLIGLLLLALVGCAEPTDVDDTGAAGTGGEPLAGAAGVGGDGGHVASSGAAGMGGGPSSGEAGASAAGAAGAAGAGPGAAGAGGSGALGACTWEPGLASLCSSLMAGKVCARCSLPSAPNGAGDLPCISSTAFQSADVVCVTACTDCP